MSESEDTYQLLGEACSVEKIFTFIFELSG